MALDTPAVNAPDTRGPRFEILATKSMSFNTGDDGRRRFHLTASSTIEDRAGDEITRDALEKAAGAFRNGITIYMNHDFKDVFSAFGLTDNATVVQRGFDEKSGMPIYDLDVEGVVNVPNPKAVQLADSIDGGYAKFGASITAWVRKHAKKRNGGMLISELEPIEASVVGVAENQRSWAHKAAVAVKSFYADKEAIMGDLVQDEEQDEESIETIEVSKDLSAAARNNLDDSQFACPEKRKYPINDAAHVRAALSRVADPSNDQCGKARIIAAARKMGIGEHASKSFDITSDEGLIKWASLDLPTNSITVDEDGFEQIVIQKEAEAPEPPVEDTGEHSTDEEPVDASSTEGEGGQESADEVETPETAPDVAEDAEAISVEKAADVVTRAEVEELVAYVGKAVVEINRLREENANLISKNAELEKLVVPVSAEVEEAKAVIKKMLDMPLRSQTAGYVEASASAMPTIYDSEVQAYLAKRSKLSHG